MERSRGSEYLSPARVKELSYYHSLNTTHSMDNVSLALVSFAPPAFNGVLFRVFFIRCDVIFHFSPFVYIAPVLEYQNTSAGLPSPLVPTGRRD